MAMKPSLPSFQHTVATAASRRTPMVFLMAKLLSVIFLFVSLVVAAIAQETAPDRGKAIAAAALERTFHDVIYDGSYLQIPYPGGDVSNDRGVCSDVVVRSFRSVGTDLQVLIHEDMSAAFDSYPAIWGLTRPDPNIDHRRVPNIRRFLERKGAALPLSRLARDYAPGDLVTWNIDPSGSLPHIGIISEQTSPQGTPLIVHNIGRGPKLEDVLFDFEMTGHYRYSG